MIGERGSGAGVNEDTATSDDATIEETGPLPQQRSASRTLAVNAAANWVLMGVEAIVQIFLLGYLFPRVGRENYGIYQLALAVTGMTQIFRFGMTGSVLRLAAEDIAGRDWDHLAETLSVMRTLLVGLGATAWILMVVVSVFFLEALGVAVASGQGESSLRQLVGLSAA